MDKLKAFIYKSLRKLEPHAKTDMVYATKSGFWLVTNQVFGALVSLVLSILFAHFLSKETFGIYKYIISLAGIATAFSLTGVNAAVIRGVAQGYDGVLKQSIRVQALWCIPQFLFSFVLALYYFYNGNSVYGICFIIICIASPITGIANTYTAFLNGKKDFRTFTFFNMGSNALYFVAMATISIWSADVILLITGYFVSVMIANTYFCWRALYRYPRANNLTRTEDMPYAKSLSVMNIGSTIAQHVDNIVIFHFMGSAQLAIYSFATIIPERIRSMFGIISTAALPKLAEKNADETTARRTRAGIRPKVFRLILLAIVIIILYIVAAPYIFYMLFPQYAGSIVYSQVFSLCILVIASYIPVPALFAGRKQKELNIINVGLPVARIIVSIGAIIIFGIWGAIFTKIGYYLLLVVVSSHFASRAPRSV
jgi:O-antigen/teichoic acid export membrane protein